MRDNLFKQRLNQKLLEKVFFILFSLVLKSYLPLEYNFIPLGIMWAFSKNFRKLIWLRFVKLLVSWDFLMLIGYSLMYSFRLLLLPTVLCKRLISSKLSEILLG